MHDLALTRQHIAESAGTGAISKKSPENLQGSLQAFRRNRA